jgi:hypothetical protein
LFCWFPSIVLPDSQLIVFARSDDYFYGLMHSRLHELWALNLGTRLETRPRYTPTTCFETFPFPELGEGDGPPSSSPAGHSSSRAAGDILRRDSGNVAKRSTSRAAELRDAIADAARELDRLRSNWLNPPEWTRTEVLEFPGTVGGHWDRFIEKSEARREASGIEIGTVKYPRVVAKNEDSAKLLAERTLTNLYNQRPTWLDIAHRKLDEAVFAAYGWDPGMSDEDLLAALLALNLERAASK